MNHDLYRLGLEYYESAARLKTRIDKLRAGHRGRQSVDHSTRIALLYSEYLDAMHTARYLVETYGEENEQEAAG